MPAFTRRQRFILAVVPLMAAFVIRVLGSTLRFEDVKASSELPTTFHRPCIYGFWHRTLLLATYRFRNQGIAILISRSFDGELIARTVRHLGYYAVRGSSSNGGSSALRQFADAYRNGYACGFTSDGPRGPVDVAKPGPVHLADLVDAGTIGAFHFQPERAWRLRSWDGFLIPKPFSRVVVAWPKLIEPTQQGLQQALDEAVRMAAAATRPSTS